MALTSSTMMPLGTRAPDFSLFDTTNQVVADLTGLRGTRVTLVMFICNHCPFVRHIEGGLRALAEDYPRDQVSLIAISSNDVEAFPDDAPDKMAAKQYPFPYLYDATQQVAKAYNAACTPDFFLFDDALRCVYRGRFDGSRPGNQQPVTGEEIRSAIDALLEGRPVRAEQKPSMGCNIKWKR